MAIVDTNKELKKGLVAFYSIKSIQKNYLFGIKITDTATKPVKDNPMPRIEDYHIIDVSFPSFVFAKELFYIGQLPRAFPVYRGETFEFTITFEEDDSSTIQTFINYLQRKIITPDGLYVPPDLAKSLSITIIIKTDYAAHNIYYHFKKCFFLKADDTKMDYKSGDSLKYNITFNADSFEILVPGQAVPKDEGKFTPDTKLRTEIPKFQSAIPETTRVAGITGPRS
jgi:hypothetical protein